MPGNTKSQRPQKPPRGRSSESIGRGPDGRRPVAGHALTPSSARNLPLLVALASTLGVFLSMMLVGLSVLSVTQSAVATVASQPDPIASDPRSKGNPNAPVVVTEWFDFQ